MLLWLEMNALTYTLVSITIIGFWIGCYYKGVADAYEKRRIIQTELSIGAYLQLPQGSKYRRQPSKIGNSTIINPRTRS